MSRKIQQPPKQWWHFLIVTTTLIYIIFSVFHKLPQLEMHMDEHEWLRRSMLFIDAGLIRHNFHDPIWTGFYARDQSNLAEYIYGIWTWITYRQNPVNLMQQTQFNQQWIEGVSGYGQLWTQDKWWMKYSFATDPTSVIPSQYRQAYQIIITNRYLSTSFFIGTSIIIFLLVKSLFGFLPAIFSSIFFVNFPLNQLHSRQAMLGSIVTFFFTSCLFLLIKQNDSIKTIILLGFIAGLTAATRIDGLITILLIACILTIETIYSILQDKNKNETVILKNWIKRIVIMAGTALLVFYILTPFVWKNPITKVVRMVTWRQYWTDIIANNINPEATARNVRAQFNNVALQIIMPYRKPVLPIFNYLQIANFTIGFLYLIFITITTNDRLKYSRAILWTLGLYIVMSSYMKVDFERYYLPILPLGAIIHSAGIAALIQLFRNVDRGGIEPPSPQCECGVLPLYDRPMTKI